MWLFDNLFLDQNTPVTINDGVDHSKDIVMPVLPPQWSWVPWDDKNPQKDDTKDDTVSDLFSLDNKGEATADITLHPPLEQDIALEIGHGPVLSTMPPADPTLWWDIPTSDELVSFEIGWDISFDIGWDMGTLTDAPATSAVADPVVTESTEKSEEPVLSGVFLSPTEITQSTPEKIVSTTPEVQSSQIQTLAQSISVWESILPDVPPLDAKVGVTPIDPVSLSQPSVPTQPSTPIETGAMPSIPTEAWANSLFDLIGWSPEVEPKPVEIPVANDPMPSTVTTTESSIISPVGETPLTSLMWSTPRVPASPLREKLFSYVDELKSMKIHDQTQKSHKLKQIEVLEERIREIDQEAIARKKVIKREIDMLHREIDSMDQEDEELDSVVSSFEKEIISA
jgi:hypothetical protein